MGSSALGTIVSFHVDGATGACIVLIQAAIFVLAFLLAPKHGLLNTRTRRSAQVAAASSASALDHS